MQYAICQNVFYKQLGDDFLAYSSQSGETMMLHQCAFQILQSLSQACSYDDLLKMLANLSNDADIDLSTFLQNSLSQFVELGFVNVSEPA